MKTKNQYSYQALNNEYSTKDPLSKTYQPELSVDDTLAGITPTNENNYQVTGKLTGRRALISAGSSGLAQAVAIAFAHEGADIVFNYLPSEQQNALSLLETLHAANVKAYAIEGDISEERFCKYLVQQAAEKLGGIDILVNNAGNEQVEVGSIDLHSEQFKKTYARNVFAMIWLTNAALPHLHGGSSIIHSTSRQIFKHTPDLLGYASSKSAVIGFTKSLAKKVIEKGIRVNAVAPKAILSQPQLSYPQSAEIAQAYVYLESEESSHITAEVISIKSGVVSLLDQQ